MTLPDRLRTTRRSPRAEAFTSALTAIRDAARNPLALAFVALTLLAAQILLRATLARTSDVLIGLAFGRELPEATTALLGLAFLCAFILQGAALCGGLGALARRSPQETEAEALLDGLAALPSALGAHLVGWATSASVAFFVVAALGALDLVASPTLRALVFAVSFAPGTLAITWSALAALLASGWLASGALPAAGWRDGLAAFGRAAVVLVANPGRTTAAASALCLCTTPLALLVALTSLSWSVRPLPAALGLHLAQTLAAGAWIVITSRGLCLAFPIDTEEPPRLGRAASR